MPRRKEFIFALLAALTAAACTDTDFTTGGAKDGAPPAADRVIFSDNGSLCSNPGGDYDGDGISNAQEGCLTGLDSDGDKVPDWQDFDSDGDKLPDSVEKGAKDAKGKCLGAKPGKDKWPCDTDGDGVPDYLDKDSDGDGLKDGDEDANADGKVGCCLSKCKTFGSAWQQKNCKLVASSPAKPSDGCGQGQKCANGACLPAVGFGCSEGETSPVKKDTFGDGKLDNERGTFICRDATEDKPLGRKPLQLRVNQQGDWHIALEKHAKYGEPKISGATAKQAAGIIDHSGATEEVAGFVISRDTTATSIQDEVNAIIAKIQSSGLGTAVARSSGTSGRSHDLYEAVRDTIVDVSSSSQDVASARNQLVALLLGKQLSALSNLSGPFGGSSASLVVKFTTIKRIQFKKDTTGKVLFDSQGKPIDSGDSSKWRLIIVGSVSDGGEYKDPKRDTGIIADDLANGSGVAVALDKVGNECDVGNIGKLPSADIIWVVDTSGSMYNNQADVANNANAFFSRALASGLDFRMAVMPSCENRTVCQGRFLQPGESAKFSACIKSPGSGSCETGLASAMEAVKDHLPRAANDPKKIRTDATLVIIQVTDELPQKLKSKHGYGLNKCKLTSTEQANVDSFIAGYKNFYAGITDPDARAVMHGIAGVCNNSCGAEKGHGYMELAQYTGGIMGDICQKNLGNTLQSIIDTITGAASPITLDYVPISSSLAVALNAQVVKRSRSNGFDYRASANALVFVNIKYKKGSEVIASYKRWERQTILK